MDKLRLFVGLVYTQLMFCDEHGKLQFHRVMTDVDRPWLSIKELLRMVKQVLCSDKPIDYNFPIGSIHIDIQYRIIHFTSLLESLREEMECYLSGDCEVFIQTNKENDEFTWLKPLEKVENLESSGREFRPLEVMDLSEEADIIQVLWVSKEWNVALSYSEYSTTTCRYEPYEISEEGQIMNLDRIPLLSTDEGQTNWKKQHNLRGSPNVKFSILGTIEVEMT